LSYPLARIAPRPQTICESRYVALKWRDIPGFFVFKYRLRRKALHPCTIVHNLPPPLYFLEGSHARARGQSTFQTVPYMEGGMFEGSYSLFAILGVNVVLISPFPAVEDCRAWRNANQGAVIAILKSLPVQQEYPAKEPMLYCSQRPPAAGSRP
jgi:hypothetical protein